MKALVAGLILTLAALGPAEQLIAQSPGLPNEGSRLEYDGANRIWRFKWWGKSGRTYFIQHTDDLNRTWQWLPFVEAGNGSVREWGFNPSGDKFFIRLKYSDIPTNNPSLADFDGDRVSNLDEVTQGTNPLLAPDTNSNGLPDDWETFYFGAIGQNPMADPDGDGHSNLQEFQAGSDPLDFYDRPGGLIIPQIQILSGNGQAGLPAKSLKSRLTVQVIDSVTGQPVANAPVVFTPSSGRVSRSLVRADSSGRVGVTFTTPESPGSSTILAAAGAGSVLFTATTVESAELLPPNAPSEFTTIYNLDGSRTLSWRDNSENEDVFVIWTKNEQNAWVEIGTVPANKTTATITPEGTLAP